MNTDKAEFLKFNLLENGIDFILKGIDELFDEQYFWEGSSSPLNISLNSYKYGYLHLFSGFLLLLKERLSRHIPELIFKGKIVDVKLKLANSTTLNTVDLDEALERLEIGPKVTFSEREISVIRSMQKARNEFEHYQVFANKYHLWATVTEFLDLIDKFLVQELQITIESSAYSIELDAKIKAIGSVWERIREQKEKDWMKELQGLLKKFKASPEKIIDELEKEYSFEDSTTPFINCPECSDETLIALGEFAGICTNPQCYNIHMLTHCNRCDEIIVGYPWNFNLCESCDNWIDEQ